MSTPGRRTVLLIDDDDNVTKMLAKRLGVRGIDCIVASSGGQGLAEFQRHGADLVISDLNMRGGDGISLAEAIRRISPVPIVFVTGFRDDFKRRLRGIPNVTTLRKPFSCQELIDLVGPALGDLPMPFASPEQENP